MCAFPFLSTLPTIKINNMARGGKLHRLRLGIRTYGEQHPMNSYMIVACIFCIFGGLCQYFYEGGGFEILLGIFCLVLGIVLAFMKMGTTTLLQGVAIKNKLHLCFYLVAIFLLGAMACYVWVKTMFILDSIYFKNEDEDFLKCLYNMVYMIIVGCFFYQPYSLLLRGIIRNWTLHSGYNKRY